MSQIKITNRDRERAYRKSEGVLEQPETKLGRFLCVLAEISEAVGSSRGYQYHSLSTIIDIKRGKNFRAEYKRQMNVIYALKKRRLITTKRKGEQLYLQLTSKGWQKFLNEKRYLNCLILPDDQWCLISFDIPEDVKELRSMVRTELKRADFEMVHKSLWRSKRDISKEFSEVIKTANSGRWVRIFIGRETI